MPKLIRICIRIFTLLLIFLLIDSIIIHKKQSFPSRYFLKKSMELTRLEKDGIKLETEGAYIKTAKLPELSVNASGFYPQVNITTSKDCQLENVNLLLNNINAYNTSSIYSALNEDFMNSPTTLKIPQQKVKAVSKTALLTGISIIAEDQEFIQFFPKNYDPENFSFAFCADLHTKNKKNPVFTEIIKDVNTQKPLFLMLGGDLVDTNNAGKFKIVEELTKKINIPYFTIPGNHDTAGGNYKNYMSYFGLPYYSFDYGNAHFICLDNSLSYIYPQQMEWLKKDLETGTAPNIFVFMHIPPKDPRSWGHHEMRYQKNTEELMLILKKYKIDCIFTGHIHGFYKEQLKQYGIPLYISGGAGGILVGDPVKHGFNNYLLITVNKNRFAVEKVPIGENKAGILARVIHRIWEPLNYSLYTYWYFYTFLIIALLVLWFRDYRKSKKQRQREEAKNEEDEFFYDTI